MNKPAILAVVAAAVLACDSSVLVADGSVTVLKEPYPAGYPSTHPLPNSVVAMLSVGQRVKVKDVGYCKDFKYYKVALPSAGSGYVIFGEGAFHIEE